MNTDEVATLGGIRLGRAGTAFELNTPPREDRRVTVGAWVAEARAGLHLVVLRGRGSQYISVARAARRRAEEAIDLLSVRGLEDLTLRKPADEHVAWWTGSHGLTIRILSTSTLTVTVGDVTVTVRDAKGRIVRPRRVAPPRWHESYRFFRLSQTTTDLFDAYRNAYLALESVLSHAAPIRLRQPAVRGESEGDWFKRALVATGVDLTPFAGRPGDPTQILYDELYVALRVTVFHAKSNRPTLLPRHEPNRAQVVAGLERTQRLYLAIVDKLLGLRRLGGGISTIAAQRMLSAVFDEMSIFVSSDEAPVDVDVPLINPGGQPIALLPHTDPADYRGFGASRLSWASAADLISIPFVRRAVGASAALEARVSSVLEGRLFLGEAKRLEVLLAARMMNARDMRQDYA